MAIQMTGGKGSLRMGPCDAKTFQPDLDWLQGQLDGPKPPKLVYVVNPCNPTGETTCRQQCFKMTLGLCCKHDCKAAESYSPGALLRVQGFWDCLCCAGCARVVL